MSDEDKKIETPIEAPVLLDFGAASSEISLDEKPEEKSAPTSFEELDAFKAEQEKEEAAQETLVEAEIVVSNIFQKEEFAVEDKVTALKKVASELGSRFKGAVKAVSEVGIKETEFDGGVESGISLQKDLEGNWRFLGWVSNNFKDRDGEIISEKAHEEFVSFLNENPEHAPEFWSWHTKETSRENKVDWWSYTNGFLLVSGKLTTKEARILSRSAKDGMLGMSHGFYVLERDTENPSVITKYRSFEVSDLPLEFAANAWTDITVVEKGVPDMSKDVNQQDYLEKILGKDAAAAAIANTQEASAQLGQAGVDSKEADEVVEEVKEVVEAVVEEESKSDDIFIAPEALVKAIADQFGMPQLSEWVDQTSKEVAEIAGLKKDIATLIEKVNNLQVEDDEKIAKTIAPPIAESLSWMRASDSKETVLDENDPKDKELLDNAPASSWFSTVNS